MVVNEPYVMGSFPTLIFWTYITVKKRAVVAQNYAIFLPCMMGMK